MRHLLLAAAILAGLAGNAHAQSATCRDGTVLTGLNASRMCAAHGGLPPGTPGGPQDHARPSRPQQPPEARPPAMQPRTAPRSAPDAAGAALGGGPGQVWVNTATKVYHCPGTQYYGTTKRGEYVTEAAARASGAHAAGGRTCS